LSWRENFDAELRRAESARRDGNEGMCRVCARRAAGIAAREYFFRRGVPVGGLNALNALRMVTNDLESSSEARRLAGHFTLQITADHTLPEEIDLLEEARQLTRALLGEYG